jgi:ParB family chromosome partitioning protein
LELPAPILTSMDEFWNALALWSNETFGVESWRGPLGPLKHLAKEAQEAQDAPDEAKRREEIADCLFLVFDAARR